MKNEKANLLCRKVKQLNIVINEFTKENHDREKQVTILQKKYEKQLDQIFSNYQTKIQRMTKSFYGQQKYFIDLFRPQYENDVIKMKTRFVNLCKTATESFENYQNSIEKLVSEVNFISNLIFNLEMNEDIILENIANSMILKIENLKNKHLSDLQLIKQSNEEKISKLNNLILPTEENNKSPNQLLIHNYIKIQMKSMKTRISLLKQYISNVKKEFTNNLTDYKMKMQNIRKQTQQVMGEIQQIKNINDQHKVKQRSNSDIEKIVFSLPSNDKKLKTVLSANSIMEFKLLINEELKELQHLLNETRQNNQREIFDTQFIYREEKNSLLKNYSDLISIIKMNIENQEISNKLDKQYKDEKMKKKIEIEKIKNQLDNEFFEKKEKIESKNNRCFTQTKNSNSKNLFEQERLKYEAEFHRLSNQLTPQNSEDRRQILRIELISQFLKEIEFENKRHSLQMLLFDLQRSSQITINAAISNATNRINLLREAIKKQIEINKQGMINTTFSSSNLKSISSSSEFSIENDDFSSEKNRIALRAIKTSESNRTNSLNLQRKLDKQRMELLNFYEEKIRNIQNKKDEVKKDIYDFNQKMSSKTNAIKYKLFSLVETYKQLALSENAEKKKLIDKINSKYDGQIDSLKKSIDSMKKGNPPGKGGSQIEAKIEKMNWHCEFLNSQLNALIKQLRIAQRTPKSPDQTLKAQRRIKSSFSITAVPHTYH